MTTADEIKLKRELQKWKRRYGNLCDEKNKLLNQIKELKELNNLTGLGRITITTFKAK